MEGNEKRGLSPGDWAVIAVTFLFAVLIDYLGSTPTKITAVVIALIILLAIYLDRKIKRGLLKVVEQFLLVGFIGGIAGLGSIMVTAFAYSFGWGHLGYIFFYITPHMVFKIGLRFIHPQIFKKTYLFLEREVLVSLYAFPVSLFTFGVLTGSTLESLVTGQFLVKAHDPSLHVTPYFVIEAVFGILLSLAFYGYGMAMALESAENIKSSTHDTVVVGIGDGVIVTSAAYMMYKFGGFPTTIHAPTKGEFANCFLFSALLAAAVFNAYRLRRIYALHRMPSPWPDRSDRTSKPPAG